jgi:hypothetical protein
MTPKSGYRFSDKVMRRSKAHDPEKWAPVFGQGHAQSKAHDPEKWAPVFGQGHAQKNAHDPEKACPGLDPGRRFWRDQTRLPFRAETRYDTCLPAALAAGPGDRRRHLIYREKQPDRQRTA